MSYANLARIINSGKVQAKLRLVKTSVVLSVAKKNLLHNHALMNKLNPSTKLDASTKEQK